jgi:TonB family protein
MPEAWEKLQGRVVGGKFHLSRYLGGSQRGAVFLTERHQGQPKTAAIKLIAADAASADLQLARWKQISKLSHPHLLRLFEMGRCQQDGVGLVYVVTEYAEENLAQVLPSRPLTPDEARDMLQPTLQALAYLHGRGFVHGHLKPANIMVVHEQLKISSDELCPIGERDHAEAGSYGPPESSGTPAAPARDVWSLGVTVVHVLTQLLPVWDGKEQQAPILPDTLPPPFLEIARNSLQRDPRRRWTLDEIAAYLQFTLPAPTEATATQRPATHNPQKPAGRGRYTVPAFAILLTLAALVVGVRLFDRPPAQPASSAALGQPTPQRPGTGTAAQTPAETPPLARATRRKASDAANLAPPSAPEPRATAAAGAPVQGQVVQQVLPDVPRSASDTIRGTVRVTVRVHVDAAGGVSGNELVSAGPSRYFARLASEAARRWKFSPARRDGRSVPSAWLLRFEFTRGGTRAIPVADS